MSSSTSNVPNGEKLHSPLSNGTSGKYGYTSGGKKKRILLNAFDMNGIGHIRYYFYNFFFPVCFSVLILRSPGQWQNPEDKSATKNRLDYWIYLAKLLDRGKFNALFLGMRSGFQLILSTSKIRS